MSANVAVAALGPMDSAGWFEAFLGGPWYTFDPRNNRPRIGRVLIALGRDAADVPMRHTFGPQYACHFQGMDGRGQRVLSTPLRPGD